MFNENEMDHILENINEPTKTVINDIVVLHEITLGDIIITTLLTAILIFMILSRVIRRV